MRNHNNHAALHIQRKQSLLYVGRTAYALLYCTMQISLFTSTSSDNLSSKVGGPGKMHTRTSADTNAEKDTPLFAQVFAAQDSDPTQGQNTRDRRLLRSHADEILTADGFIEKLKVRNVQKMAKKGKLQCQETHLPSGKSKNTFAMGVAGSSVAAVTRIE